MEYWGIKELKGKPTKNKLPSNILHKSTRDKQACFEESVGKFVDVYVFNDPEADLAQRQQSLTEQSEQIENEYMYFATPNISEPRASLSQVEQMEDDWKRNYGSQMINLTLTLLQLKDTAAEADGDRASINEKLLLTFFKASNNYSKYALEMFLSIVQKEAFLSEREAEKQIWGKFVNWQGGLGRNIENDLAQEIYVRLTKELIRSMGANKTEKAIATRSKAVSGIREIVANNDGISIIHTSSSRHTKISSHDDEIKMIQDLQALVKPFQFVSGRRHPSFPDIPANQRSVVDMRHFHQWITNPIKQIGNS